MLIRSATESDLPALTELHNHYVVNTHITFDLEPYTVDDRRSWLDSFGASGPHRLLVADHDGVVIGYGCSTPFRCQAWL